MYHLEKACSIYHLSTTPQRLCSLRTTAHLRSPPFFERALHWSTKLGTRFLYTLPSPVLVHRPNLRLTAMLQKWVPLHYISILTIKIFEQYLYCPPMYHTIFNHYVSCVCVRPRTTILVEYFETPFTLLFGTAYPPAGPDPRPSRRVCNKKRVLKQRAKG